MVKSIFFVKRKPEMELEAFGKYWREVHGPIAAKLPRLRRYVQSHTIPSGYRKGEPVYDGTAELWFDDLDSVRRAFESSQGRAALADCAHFIDLSKFGSIVTEEYVAKDGPATPEMVKLVEFITRKAGMSIEAFQKHWRETHGPLGAALPDARRYVQSHVLPSSYNEPEKPRYDGVPIVWFDSTAAMRESEKRPQYPALRADEPNFIEDPKNFPLIITREYVVV